MPTQPKTWADKMKAEPPHTVPLDQGSGGVESAGVGHAGLGGR